MSSIRQTYAARHFIIALWWAINRYIPIWEVPSRNSNYGQDVGRTDLYITGWPMPHPCVLSLGVRPPKCARPPLPDRRVPYKSSIMHVVWISVSTYVVWSDYK